MASASASAREPVIAYIEGGQFKLYDAEIDSDVAAPPVAIDGPQFRFGISRNGRYVFYVGGGVLRLFDRDIPGEVPLPGIDVYAQPGFLTVSDGGLLAFDNNANGPAVAYNANTKAFVATGLIPTNGNRQTQLSGNGMFLATTCVLDCPALAANADPFVQDLVSMTDTAIPVDDMKDEEDPCINGDGTLVGWHKQIGAGDKDIVVYDRAAAAPVNLAGLNDAALDDTYCSMDSAGEYIAHLTDNAVFRLYEVSSDSHVTLDPGKPFDVGNFHNQILSDPFTPTPKPPPAAPAPAPAATSKKKKCQKKKKKKKKKRCKKKKKKRR